jgi:hypothetical protein
VLPAATVAGIVFHRGFWQAFFVGCAPVISYAWVGHFLVTYPMFDPWPLNLDLLLRSTDDLINEKMKLTLLLMLYGTSGLVATGVRWWALVLGQRSAQGYGN